MKVLDKSITQITIPTPFAVGDVHVYLIKGDTLSLVDAGVRTKAAWESLTIQLREIGYTPDDIEQIILTHHHPDHIGLIEEFPRVEHIVAHEHLQLWLTRNESFINRYIHFFKNFFIRCGVPEKYHYTIHQFLKSLSYAGRGELTNIISEGDVLPGHNEWQVVETKGHAQSHLSFLKSNDGTFIGGDHILSHISSNPLLEPPMGGESERPKPLLQYRANLRKCLELDINIVLPGHGRLITDIDELIPIRLKKQNKRAGKVLALLKGASLTPFQICQKIFPDKYQSQLELTMSKTIGMLDLLEEKGLINKKLNNLVLLYYASDSK